MTWIVWIFKLISITYSFFFGVGTNYKIPHTNTETRGTTKRVTAKGGAKANINKNGTTENNTKHNKRI